MKEQSSINVTSFLVFHTKATVIIQHKTVNGLRHASGPVLPSHGYINVSKFEVATIKPLLNSLDEYSTLGWS